MSCSRRVLTAEEAASRVAAEGLSLYHEGSAVCDAGHVDKVRELSGVDCRRDLRL